MICFLKEWKEFTVKKSEATGFLEGAEYLPLIMCLKCYTMDRHSFNLPS